MDRAYPSRRVFVHPAVLIVGWLTLTGAYVAALGLTQPAGYNTWAAVLIGPIPVNTTPEIARAKFVPVIPSRPVVKNPARKFVEILCPQL